jgi:hypothetical protein
VGTLPAFYTRVYSLRCGEDAMEVYHDRSECHRGQKILEDNNERLRQQGRRRCAECRQVQARALDRVNQTDRLLPGQATI